MGYKFNPFTGSLDEAGPSISALNLLGTVADEASLPGGATTGDVYQAEDTGAFYVWDGAAWDNVGTLAGPTGPTGPAGSPGDDIYVIACSTETTSLSTGTAKATFRMPTAGTLTAVKATVTTAPVGSALIVDINEAGTSVLSTKLSIDASEKTSTTATTAAVISDSVLADDAEITIDIDQVGSTTAGAGLKVYLYVTRG